MDPFIILAFIIFLPFAAAFVLPIIGSKMKEKIGWFATLISFICFLAVLYLIPNVSREENLSGIIPWINELGINFSLRADGLSILLAAIVSFIGIMIMFYSNGYMSPKDDLNRYYQYLLVFMGSMLGIAFSDNLILLFLFWELTSISSFLLIGYYRDTEKSIYGARKALLITAGGGLFMLLGFIAIGLVTGTYEISQIVSNPEIILNLKSSPDFAGILILILIGAFAKSAQGIFYIWLPNAMEAPTPVSAFLHSATMVKAGIFLIARFHPVFSGTDLWFYLVSGTGMITMIFAGYIAIRQTDLKAILAYSTISQLAYLVTMYGFTTEILPTIGVSAATFHLLNHSTFKACLFLIVGIVAHELGTRDIREMGGLAKKMPITFIIAIIAAASMAGIPPFNGYLSKELFYESSIIMGQQIGGIWSAIIPMTALAGGVLTFMYSLRLIHKVFLGKPANEEMYSKAHEPGAIMLIPPIILAALIVLIGLFPDLFIEYLVQPAINSIAPGSEKLHVQLWHGFTRPFIMTVFTIAIGLFFYMKYDEIAESQNRFCSNYKWFSLNNLYDKAVNNARSESAKISGSIQRGPPTGYIIWMLVFTIFLILIPLSGFYFSGGNLFDPSIMRLPASEYFLLAIIVITAIGAAIAPKYIVAIMSLSAMGYLVALLYAYLKAPDLAMTQVCVETLSTILFLAVIMKLRKKEAVNPDPRSDQITKLLIGFISGFSFLLVIMATGIVEPFVPFSEYFIENAIELTGGRNIVNVIVVDFRGYDTIGEITVLSLAALCVYNIIRAKGMKKEKKKESKEEEESTNITDNITDIVPEEI